VATRNGAGGEHFDEETGDVVWESRVTKKAPGTIKQIAPIFGSGLNFQLSIPLLR
jgi:hypothetical protein